MALYVPLRRRTGVPGGRNPVSSSTTVDGLVSGMNTTQVIAQLMQLAAQPQTDLKNQVAQENTVISAYQSVNSRLAALQTAAGAFTQPSPRSEEHTSEL